VGDGPGGARDGQREKEQDAELMRKRDGEFGWHLDGRHDARKMYLLLWMRFQAAVSL